MVQSFPWAYDNYYTDQETPRYGTRNFTSTFTEDRRWTVFWISSVLFTSLWHS